MLHKLRAGDHIVCRRRGYAHHGIYVGNDMVIHYWGVQPNKTEACVQRSTLRTFAGPHGKVDVVEYGNYLCRDEVVRRAERRLGERSYNALFENCKHFACWCKTGDSASYQVERAAAFAGGTTGGIAATVATLSTVGAAGAVAGFDAAGIMSGLAWMGGTATTGIGVVAVAPALAATMATHHALRDSPHMPTTERSARRAGRQASTASAIVGTSATLAWLSAAGLPGINASGISTGLVAMGGSMLGGLMVSASLPALAAVVLGSLVYRARR